MDDAPATIEPTLQDHCCAAAGPTAGTSPAPALRAERAALIGRAFRLEYATLGWMAIEATVAIVAGLRARSVALGAFGIDSVIEIASALVLIWRLNVELRRGEAFGEQAERLAGRLAGGLLFALAASVVIMAAFRLAARAGASFSWPGLAVTLAAMPVMYLLARRKIAVADALGSRAMRADAMESITCFYLSLVVVIGLAVQAVTGAWWVDAATSLGVVWFLVREGREAWTGTCCC
ncbi:MULTISPECIES: cation transporter [Acidiphilium]|uniref:Co/Zn/Cd cation transporter-like protein n=1 Tax=Acidiphilium cryptum (strain JF-5) TaxID=349163 RepID=A5FXL0_ACICJ|nr:MULTISPECIES: cation transporter [Acidiphilium]ABQ30342.1 Co/Zn/Cd cation transporter-like protein [Acidiphilium cryptum JF-5]